MLILVVKYGIWRSKTDIISMKNTTTLRMSQKNEKKVQVASSLKMGFVELDPM